MKLLSDVNKSGGSALAFAFFSISAVLFLILLQFNALPSGQIYLAPVVILFLILLALFPAHWLSVVTSHRKIAALMVIGPVYLIISSLGYSYWPWLSLWMSSSFLLLPLSVLLLINFRHIGHKHIVGGFIAAVFINALLILFLAYQGVNRPSGFLDDPNLAANFCALALLASLFLIQSQGGVKKRFLLIAFILGASLFVSFSRGALLSLAGACTIYFSLCQMKNLDWKRSFLIFGLILAASFLAASLLLEHPSKLSGLSLNDRPGSMSDRFDMWRSAWSMFLELPVLGTGLATFMLRYPALRAFSETSSTGFFAHNDYLQLLAELGVLGFLAWFLVPATLLILTVRSYLRAVSEMDSKLHCLAISAICLVGAHSFFNFVMYHPVVNVFLGCLLGASIRAGWLRPAPDNTSKSQKTSLLGARAALGFAIVLIAVSFAADLFSKKPIAEAEISGSNFNFKSEGYYELLALKYFSPLNIEIRNYLIVGDVNAALNLADMPLGLELSRQVIKRIDNNERLLWENCPQLVNKARLQWLTDKMAAIAILESVLVKVPSCIRARITLADAYISFEDYSQAIRLLNTGVDRFAFRENLGDGPIVLLETLIQAYRYAGKERSAEAIEAYLRQFKREQKMRESPNWSRRLHF